MNIPILTLENFEADDILGTIAKRSQKEGVSVTVLSGDRDLLQLADEDIKISIPKTSKGRTEVFHYYPEDVKNEYGVTPLEFIDVKALQGDTSDNIPGVPSIGEKTARAIIERYHSIENAYEHVEEITPPRAKKALLEHYDMAQLSKVLATIDTEAPIGFSYEEAEVKDLYNEKALSLIKRLEFKTIAARFAEAGKNTQEPELSLPEPKLVEDKYMAGVILKDALLEKKLSFVIFGDEKGSAAGLCLSGDRLYVLKSSEKYPSEELLSDVGEMLRKAAEGNAELYTMELKRQLPYLPVRRSGRILDLAIGAYLLNPLKDTYDHEDLARDYLDAAVPSVKELLGKNDPLSALFGTGGKQEPEEELREKGRRLLGLMASIPYLAAKFVIRKLKDHGIYCIARIVALKDPYIADQKPEWALHLADGSLFRDNKGDAWVNPYKQEYWDYLVDVAKAAGAIGFDEIQFDYIRFCTERGIDDVVYDQEDTQGRDKISIITELVGYMSDKLREEGLFVSCDVFGTIIGSPIDAQSVGQDYNAMAEEIDYICPMIYPSHYSSGNFGLEHPDTQPYECILGALTKSRDELLKTRGEGIQQAVVRPWLQSFTASYLGAGNYIEYNAETTRAQIQAVYDAGYDEWILWSASANYFYDGLLSPEAAEAEAESIAESRAALPEETVPPETLPGNAPLEEGDPLPEELSEALPGGELSESDLQILEQDGPLIITEN